MEYKKDTWYSIGNDEGFMRNDGYGDFFTADGFIIKQNSTGTKAPPTYDYIVFYRDSDVPENLHAFVMENADIPCNDIESAADYLRDNEENIGFENCDREWGEGSPLMSDYSDAGAGKYYEAQENTDMLYKHPHWGYMQTYIIPEASAFNELRNYFYNTQAKLDDTVKSLLDNYRNYRIEKANDVRRLASDIEDFIYENTDYGDGDNSDYTNETAVFFRDIDFPDDIANYDRSDCQEKIQKMFDSVTDTLKVNDFLKSLESIAVNEKNAIYAEHGICDEYRVKVDIYNEISNLCVINAYHIAELVNENLKRKDDPVKE